MDEGKLHEGINEEYFKRFQKKILSDLMQKIRKLPGEARCDLRRKKLEDEFKAEDRQNFKAEDSFKESGGKLLSWSNELLNDLQKWYKEPTNKVDVSLIEDVCRLCQRAEFSQSFTRDSTSGFVTKGCDLDTKLRNLTKERDISLMTFYYYPLIDFFAERLPEEVRSQKTTDLLTVFEGISDNNTGEEIQIEEIQKAITQLKKMLEAVKTDWENLSQ